MPINLSNLFNSQSKNTLLGDFQDLQHLDGLSISAVNAKLYQKERDDVVLFYFRHGANHASVFTQSKIVSENIKWNQKELIKFQLIYQIITDHSKFFLI